MFCQILKKVNMPGKSKKSRVIMAAIFANMSSFALGTCIGWSSPILPKLTQNSPDSPLSGPITLSQEGWISSLLTIGALATALVAGPIGGKFGKKLVLLLSGSFIEVSYILLLLAGDLWMFYIGRILQGIAAGLIMATVPMYVGEIATDEIRGATGSLMTLFMVSGVLYVYSIGSFASYATLQWFCLVIPIIFLATFSFIPETPYYLAKSGHQEDLKKSLTFLRTTKCKDIEEEIRQIQTTISVELDCKTSFLDIFRDRANVRALITCCWLLMFAELSGITAVTFNSQSIFQSANSPIDPALAPILLPLTQFVSNFLTPFVVERTGRKIILLISAIGMSVSLYALGVFFYDASPLMWIPIPCLILFNIGYAFGFGPVPWAVLGEVFPSNVKPAAATIASTVSWLTSFLITRGFPELNALGEYYAFFLFGTLSAVAIFYVLFFVIETKGLSLEEIQKKFRS